MRPNRVKRKLADGGVATIIQGELSADLIDFLGPLGFDGVWIEAEHGGLSFTDIRDQTRAADLWGMTSVARVHANEEGLIYRTLDQGVQAILMPHCNTAEEAAAVVNAAKFFPEGNRGVFKGRQANGVDDYFEKSNEEVLVGVLIEDVIAIDNLDEMLKVDNVDVYLVAVGDLAQSMGIPTQLTNPELLKVRDESFAKIVSAGKVPGAVTESGNVKEFINKGVRFITNSPNRWLEQGAKSYLEAVSQSIK